MTYYQEIVCPSYGSNKIIKSGHTKLMHDTAITK